MSMFGTIGSVLGGAGGFMLGGPAGAMTGAQIGGAIGGGMDTNEANAKQASKNRDFQEYMSNTAHQREVADLRAAGLNPILSANHSGASTPSGSTAQMSNPFDKAFSSAVEILNTIAKTQLTEAQAKTELQQPAKVIADTSSAKATKDLIEMQTLESSSREDLNRVQGHRDSVDAILKNAQIRNENLRNQLMRLDKQAAEQTLKGLRNEGEIDETKYGNAMRYVDRFFKAIGPVAPKYHFGNGR